MSHVDRRTVLKAGALAALSSPFASVLATPGHSSPLVGPFNQAVAAPADAGSWAPPFDLSGMAVHAMLTHIGEVLFFQYVEGRPMDDHTSYIATWNHLTGAIREAPIGYDRDIFCAGNNWLPDGRLYVTGGHDWRNGKRLDAVGVAEADTYDPTRRAWDPRPLLTQRRWYPTNVGLPSGKTLVFGGWDTVGYNSSDVDQYDPVTNKVTKLPPSATKNVGNYPRLHLLPDGRIVKTGTSSDSAYFDTTRNSWSTSARMNYGARKFGLSMLLSGCDRVMALGGKSSKNGPATPTVEIFDALAATPRWRTTTPMKSARLNANGVLLPDGQMFVVGGNASGTETGAVNTPELFNPTTDTWTTLAPHQVNRAYHSTALLLPDGRVFVAGGENPDKMAQMKAEIFSPPYLFKGPRPTISAAPSTGGYGQQMTIATPQAATIASVMLVKAGAVTHQIDADQRSIPLSFTKSGGSLTAQMPSNANFAPPGYYMLFIVDGNGVPSLAPWVKVG